MANGTNTFPAGALVPGVTVTIGGTNGTLLYDNNGVIGEALVGANLTLSGGVLSATGGGGGTTLPNVFPAAAATYVAIVAARALAVAAGGGTVLIPAGTVNMVGQSPLPVDAGVHYVGAPLEFIYTGQTSANNNVWYLSGGTIFQGDGTADCFAANTAALGSFPTGSAAWGISNFGLDEIGFVNFRHAVNIGGVNNPGLAFSHWGRVFATDCTATAFLLQNCVEFHSDYIETTRSPGGIDFISSAASSIIIFGNSSFGKVVTQGVDNYSTGLTLQANVTGAELNSISLGRIQCGSTRTLVSQAATMVNTSANITVTDGTKWRVGQPVQFDGTANGFVKGRTYIVLSIAANVLTVGNSRNGSAIAATGATAVNMTSYGMPDFMAAAFNGGSSVNNVVAEFLDLQSPPSAGMYLENCIQSRFTTNTIPIRGAANYVARAAGATIEHLAGYADIDFDANSVMDFIGLRTSIIQQTGGTVRLPQDLNTNNVALYVNPTTGSDLNTGMASTNPFQTATAAYNFVANNFRLQGNQATIHVAAGTVTETFAPALSQDSGIVNIVGAGRASTTWSAASGHDINLAGSFAFQGTLTFDAIKFTNAVGGYAAFIAVPGTVNFLSGVEFGACGGYHVQVFGSGARAQFIGGYYISGNVGTAHLYAQADGLINYINPTVTILANVNLNIFAYAYDDGVMTLAGATFSLGAFTVTAFKFDASMNGTIDTLTGNVNYLPGNSPGATQRGGRYDGYFLLGDGQILVGQSAADEAPRTISGDITLADTGVVAIKSSVALAGSPTTTTQAAGDNSTKIATDAFVTTAVNNAIAGVNPAVAVQAATTAAGNTSGLTYNNGVAGVGATFTGANNTALTIDGFTFTALGQRLLVKNDTQSPSGAFNGIYYVTQVQALALPPILTRALDYDQPSDMNNTGAIPVVNGTANATTSWLLTSTVNTVGTDPLTFVNFSVNPANVALLNVADQTVSGGANVTSDNLGTVSTGTLTIDCGARPLQYYTNGGAHTLAAPSNDGSCLVLATNNASAGTITFSGFSVPASPGDALDLVNGHKFTISIWRVNGVSGYRVAAMQ